MGEVSGAVVVTGPADVEPRRTGEAAGVAVRRVEGDEHRGAPRNADPVPAVPGSWRRALALLADGRRAGPAPAWAPLPEPAFTPEEFTQVLRELGPDGGRTRQ